MLANQSKLQTINTEKPRSATRRTFWRPGERNGRWPRELRDPNTRKLPDSNNFRVKSVL